MNINITLCVQCINFFVVYLFLRYALFKPVIAIIIEQENQKSQVKNEIAQQEAFIAEQFYERQQGWCDFKTHCQFNKPIIGKDEQFTQDIPIVLPEMNIDSIHIETLSKQYARLIVNHVKGKENSV